MKKLFLLASIISFTLAFASCSAPKGLKYQSVENLRILKDRNNPFLVDVKFYNPNKFPLEIRYGYLETFLEDLPLGEIKIDTVIKVHGHSTFVMPLGYNPNYRKMFPNYSKDLAQPLMNVKINGSISIERKGKFYNTLIHFQGDIPQQQ